MQRFKKTNTKIHSIFPIVNNSADQAMIHLLAGLEDDGYEIVQQNASSSGHYKNVQNSDDEENEPQIEKEEMELSLLMSQQWDSISNEVDAKRRYILFFCTVAYLIKVLISLY